jgi:hypothetical protein
VIRAKQVDSEYYADHPTLGHVKVLTSKLVDEATGQEVSDLEVVSHFLNDNILGVCVTATPQLRATSYPAFGRITDITEEYITLNGTMKVPRSKFHDWYELD